jgi:class 3 adenylate cyclase
LIAAVATPAARDATHPVLRWLMTDARRQVDANGFLDAFARERRIRRPDPTVIGAAVHLTSRIESMCRQLGRQLLLSSAFVSVGQMPAQSIGAFSLKGVGSDQEIFAPVPLTQ